MKNKFLATLITLVSSSVLLGIAKLLEFKIGLLLGLGSIPPLIFSIYYGIKEYKGFFLLQKEPDLEIPQNYIAILNKTDWASDKTYIEIDEALHRLVEREQQRIRLFVSRPGFINISQMELQEEFDEGSKGNLLIIDPRCDMNHIGILDINLADFAYATC